MSEHLLHSLQEMWRLTQAELRVAAMISEGASNPEIARRLGISRHTVESHLKHVYVKLGITSRVHLALLVNARQMAAA